MAKGKPRVRKSAAKGTTTLSKPLVMRGSVAVLLLLALLFFTRPEVIDYAREKLGGSPRQNLHSGISDSHAPLASIFTPQVLYWRDEIRRWALEHDLNPNVVATIIQIESCGDPHAESPGVGAQGLFQVMPLHFDMGENQFDREVNATAGLNHLTDCLGWSNWDIGIAFACYNAGPSVTGLAQNQWPQEAQSYYRWGRGIYSDAVRGAESSPTLERWLAAGGSRLCDQAQQVQQTFRLKE